MNRLLFDIDGVLRHLTHAARNGDHPQTWDEPMPNGQKFFEYYDDGRENEVLEAPPTPYLEVILRTWPGRINVLSGQPTRWRTLTDGWLNKNVGRQRLGFKIYTQSMEEKQDFLYRNSGVCLIDDYPNFEPWVYRRVAIVNYPYNDGVNALLRVYDEIDMVRALRYFQQFCE